MMAKQTTKQKQKKVEAITGEELTQKVKQLDHQLSKEEKAKACGYYSVNKNGLERVNMMQFLNALIEAEGIDLDSATIMTGAGDAVLAIGFMCSRTGTYWLVQLTQRNWVSKQEMSLRLF